MKQEDIERLKDICAKEGFDLVNQDGRYYIEQARNRVLWSGLNYFGLDGVVSFSFIVTNYKEIKYLKEELEAFLTNQLEKFLNGETDQFYYETSDNKIKVINKTGLDINGGLDIYIKGYDPITGMPILEPVQPVDSASFTSYPPKTNTTL